MNTKSLFYVTLSLFSAAMIATAQDAPAPAPAPAAPAPEARTPFPQRDMAMRPPRQMMGTDSGVMFARMLSRPEFVKNLGLPEEVAEKISTGLKEIDAKEKELMTKRMELLKAQTDMMAALMADRTKNGDEARKATADLEALQVQISSLNIDRMLIIRDNLSDDQIKQAREQVRKNFQNRREEMMKRRGQNGENGRGPRFNADRGPRANGDRGPRPNGDQGKKDGGEKAAAPAAPAAAGGPAPAAAK